MILMIDNYDSFVYNLYQLLGSLGEEIKVVRNDAMTIKQIEEMQPEMIVLSPGPGRPSEAGVCEEVIRTFYQKIPMLGICLGHQAMIESFGGQITYAKKIMHGKSSLITVDEKEPLFQGLSSRVEVARYHSLAGDENNWPDSLKIIAYSDDHEIMAIKHKDYPVYGLQFHPESILTKDGPQMMKNLLKEIRQ